VVTAPDCEPVAAEVTVDTLTTVVRVVPDPTLDVMVPTLAAQAAVPAPVFASIQVPAVSIGVTAPNPLALVEVSIGEPSPGGGGGDCCPVDYRHVQSTPSKVWTINHGLAFDPNVTVVDSAGEVVICDVRYGAGQIVLTFSGATSGTAYCS